LLITNLLVSPTDLTVLNIPLILDLGSLSPLLMQVYHTSPTVRIQQPSPTPTQEQPMLAQQSPFMGGGWADFQNHRTYLSALPKNFQEQRIHKRASSGSSVASAGGPPSPLSQNTLYPQIATSDTTFPSTYDFDGFSTPNTAKSLPSEMSMYNRNNPYGAVDMRRIQSSSGDDRASYAALSAPQSVSTMSHNSPATPQTNYENEYDDSKHVYGEIDTSDDELAEYLQYDLGYTPTAAYQQSLQDVFPDQQFTYQAQPMPRMAPDHRQTTMAGRLQAAQQDHMSSPTSNPRGQSPFRQNSPYNMPRQPQQPPTLQKTRTSISPKELMLDEHDIDDNATPLFSNQSQQMFAGRRNPSNLSNYYTPSFHAEPTVQIPQQYPFISQAQGSTQSDLPDSTPDFPAHLISMESTNEEGPSMPSSQQSGGDIRTQPQPTPQTAQRPMDTSSDSGTYSCTYHGCAQRFESPANLQKHKREGHRQVSPQSGNSGSASPNLALRNSQAGPHRCDRINPSTGKPCNSIFSRPYDLTRHEDTIHNNRKMKVRCHLCSEEKTFSRNDALTRHMRVVHPDVDWVGKQKRKSSKQ